MIYLDTHVVVWLYEKRLDLLSSLARRLIERETLLISPMVTLELAYLKEIRRIRVSSSTIVNYLQQKLGLAGCARPFPEVVRSSLRLSWTRDPFDRLIVGQARLSSSRLVTKDEHIHRHYRYAVW